jgi:hypothetical protein
MTTENAHMSVPPNYSEYTQNPYLATNEYLPNPEISMSTLVEKPIVIPRKFVLYRPPNIS